MYLTAQLTLAKASLAPSVEAATFDALSDATDMVTVIVVLVRSVSAEATNFRSRRQKTATNKI